MRTETSKLAEVILQTIRQARAELNGPGSAKTRAGRARSLFSAYARTEPFAPHVRDVYYASGVRGTKAALDTLESVARAFVEGSEQGQARS